MDSWDFSCPDWADRLREGRSLIPSLPLDTRAAAKAVTIFNKLHLPDVRTESGAAISFLTATGDWQRDIVAAMFGSVVDGIRMVAEPFILVPKKNNKTTGGAGIMLTALLMERQPNQMFYLYGPTQEIADRAWSQAEGMIDVDPEGVLQKRFKPRRHLKQIEDLVTGCILKVQTFDPSVATGGIPKGQLIDEVHLLGKVGHAANTLEQIRGNMQARPDSFMIQITTQSDSPPAGVFKRELALARAIRDGRFKGAGVRMLPVLYEFPEAVQTSQDRPWADPATWHQVLPNLGRSCHLQLLEAAWLAAQEKGDEEVRRWASQHLNVEIGLALHTDRWRGADYWESAAAPELVSLDVLLTRSEVAVVGIDGGGLDDLFGLAVIGRERETRNWLAWAHAWAMPEVLARRKDIAPTLRDFAAAGHMTLCRETGDDVMGAVAVCQQLRDAGVLPEQDGIGLDPQGVGVLLDALEQEGFAAPLVSGVSQGWQLSSAIWSIERRLRDGTMMHGDNSMLNWCVGNAKAEPRGNGVAITKAQAGRAKIDALAALLNAAKLMEKNPVVTASSPYRERGLIFV